MLSGLVVLAVVLAVASAAGIGIRRRQGKFNAEPAPMATPGALSAAELGVPLGTRATLVQFSAGVCAYCGPARRLLTEIAAERDDVAFVEIDAAARMDLTRRLRVLATPTVLVLDARGGVASRSSGPQRKADITAALGKALVPADGGIAP